MVADDERNRLAFLELAHFEKTGRFLYKYPILKKEKLTDELEHLRKSNPNKFTSDLVNASKNITRYESQIKTKKYNNEEEKIKWLSHIRDFKMKLEIMQKLLSLLPFFVHSYLPKIVHYTFLLTNINIKH